MYILFSFNRWPVRRWPFYLDAQTMNPNAAASCIDWRMSLNNQGYGRKRVNNRECLAHRLAWMAREGPIPQGLFVLHSCDNPKCINVRHLFLGTQRDNAQDMVSKGRHANQQKTRCKKGHLLSGENLVPSQLSFGRHCLTCHNRRTRESKRRKRAESLHP